MEKLDPEISALIAAVNMLSPAVERFWAQIEESPTEAVVAILELSAEVSPFAEAKAYALGEWGGAQILAALDAPWSQRATRADPAPEPLQTPLAWVESKAKAGEAWAIATPWAKVGNKLGYALGFVGAQALLIAFTEGVGNAIEQIAAGLGRFAGTLGRLSRVAGGAGAVLVELLGRLGVGIGAIEKLLALAIGKLLGPLLEPVEDIFVKLRDLLRKLFGVAEKEGAQLLEAAGTETAEAVDEAAGLTSEGAPAPDVTTAPTTPAPVAAPQPPGAPASTVPAESAAGPKLPEAPEAVSPVPPETAAEPKLPEAQEAASTAPPETAAEPKASQAPVDATTEATESAAAAKPKPKRARRQLKTLSKSELAQVRVRRAQANVELARRRASPGPKTEGLVAGWDFERFPNGPTTRWRPGDPVNMPDGAGNYPSWSTIRKRVWRTKAADELAARKVGGSASAGSHDPIGDLTPEELKTTAETGRMPKRVKAEIEHARIPQRVGRMLQEAGLDATASDIVTLKGDPKNLEPTVKEWHAVGDARAHEIDPNRNPTLAAPLDDRIEFPLGRASNEEIQDIIDALNDAKINLGDTDAGRQFRKILETEKARRRAWATWQVP